MTPLKILIVEDEDWVRRGLLKRMSMMADLELDISEASCYKQALRIAAQLTQLDVLFTDIMLPDQSGLDLIQPMKRLHPNLRGYIISGHPEFSFAQRAIEMGINGYLLKPVKDKELQKILLECASYIPNHPIECASHILNLPINKHTELNKNAQLLFNIREHIHRHYTEELSLTTLSEQFSISASYLSRLFKTAFGEGISEYVTKVRVNVACTLLIQTDLTTSAMAELLNYTDASYFSRVFHKQTGMLPSEYRKQVKQ